MRAVTVGRGRARATSPGALRALLLAVCAALAVLFHHGLPPGAAAMPPSAGPGMGMGMAAAAPPALRAASHGAPTGSPTAHRPPAAGTATAGTFAPAADACAAAHCTAPDVRAYQLVPPALRPAECQGTPAALPTGAARHRPDARSPSPPTPVTLCVLRT